MVAGFELPVATCVLAHVRLEMGAVLPDASRCGDPPGRLPALARLVHDWFTTVAPG